MKIGLMTPTNRVSGFGMVGWDICRNMPIDSVLSAMSVKGNERWSEHQAMFPAIQLKTMPEAARMRTISYLDKFKPDVLLAVETFHSPYVVEVCREHGVKTALIPMHEVYNYGRTQADLFICPNKLCYTKVRDLCKVLWRLPIDGRDFEYRPRAGKPKTFLHCHGYGYLNDKRQTGVVLSAFKAVKNPDLRLIVSSQSSLMKYDGIIRNDPRITIVGPQRNGYDLYRGIDCLLQPEAYAGYGRVPLEAGIQGIPVLTTAAPPMNELIPPDLLIPYERTFWLEHGKGLNATFYVVSQTDIMQAIERMAATDVSDVSKQIYSVCRKQLWTAAKARQLVKILRDK